MSKRSGAGRASVSSVWARWIVLWGLLAGVVAVVTLRLSPPPLPTSGAALAPSAIRARERLAALLGDQAPHPTGSPANRAVRARLVAALSELGIEAEVQEATACGRRTASCGRVENVIARIRGTGGAARGAVLVSAHYDSVAAGPGAGDDGAGVATLLELARIFAEAPPVGRDLILLWVDGEEDGLLGAEAFVAAHRWAPEVAVALNIDAGGNYGVATFTRASLGNARAIAAIAAAVPRPHAASLTTAAYRLTPYDTDFSAYDRAGIVTLDLGIGEDKAPYHTPLDRVEALDLPSLQHLVETAYAATTALAALESVGEAGEERVYLDLLGWTLWTCPSGLIPWLGVLCALVWAAIVAGLWRAGSLKRNEFRRLMFGWPLLVGAPVAAAAALAWSLAWAVGAEAAGQATPWIPRVTLWAAVLAVSGAAARRLAAGSEEDAAAPGVTMWAATWSWLVVIAAAVAVLSPDAAVGILPVVVAQLGVYGIVRALRWRGPLPLWWLVLGGALLPAALWSQAALRLELIFGLGGAGAAAAALPLALALSALAPLVWAAPGASGRPRRWRAVTRNIALGTCALGAAATLVTPAASPARPRRLNVVHHYDHEAERGRWLIADEPGGLPAAMRAALEGGATKIEGPAAAFEWSAAEDRSWIAAAPATGSAAPELSLVSEHRGDFGRLLRLRLRSPRGARSAVLVIPRAARVRAFAVDGATAPRYPEARRRDHPEHELYRVVGLPPAGIEVALMVATEEPITITLIDALDGLPAEGGAQALVDARPADRSQSHAGDRSLVSRVAVL
jgi:hypothetical protein